jgi:hypothetical protein
MNWLIICACAKSGRGFVQFRSRTKKNVDTALPPRWTQRTNHTSHPPPHTRRNTHEHTHTARMASSVRDKLLTTYLGASECIGCGARQAGGAVLPGWLRREPYDRRAFTGKVCTRKRLPPSGAWPGAWPGAAALTCLCSAACGGRQAARAQRTAAAGAALPYSPPPLDSHQVCVVTGGATGVGFAVSQALAEAGAHVILACRCGAGGRAPGVLAGCLTRGCWLVGSPGTGP